MILSTTETVPNREVNEIKGIARGSTVRTRNVGRDILAGLKNLVGGEIEEYTKLQADAREQALQRMVNDGTKYGADAIVNVRFTWYCSNFKINKCLLLYFMEYVQYY